MDTNDSVNETQQLAPTPPATFQIESWPIDRIEAGNGGPIRGMTADELEALRKSVESYGIQHPLIVSPSGTLIDGRARLQVARELGLDQVPVRIAQEDGPEHATEIRYTVDLDRKHLAPLERFQAELQRTKALTRLSKSRPRQRSELIRRTGAALGMGYEQAKRYWDVLDGPKSLREQVLSGKRGLNEVAEEIVQKRVARKKSDRLRARIESQLPIAAASSTAREQPGSEAPTNEGASLDTAKLRQAPSTSNRPTDPDRSGAGPSCSVADGREDPSLTADGSGQASQTASLDPGPQLSSSGDHPTTRAGQRRQNSLPAAATGDQPSARVERLLEAITQLEACDASTLGHEQPKLVEAHQRLGAFLQQFDRRPVAKAS